VTPTDPTKAVFVGVAPESAVTAYLAGVDHAVVSDWMDGGNREVVAAGSKPRSAPAAAGIWSAQSSGTGTRTLSWKPTGGSWAFVVMNADGSPGLTVRADVGASVPDLAWIAGGLLAVGGILLIGGVLLVAIPAGRVSRERAASRPPVPPAAAPPREAAMDD